MFRILFLLFLIVPIVEIAILIHLGEIIGGWPTIAIVVITAYLGAKIVKQQGLQTIAQIQAKSAAGQIPSMELFTGVCILISGVLLLTPGILTDILGFLLLTPMVRKRMADALKGKIFTFVQQGGSSAHHSAHNRPDSTEFSSMFTFSQTSRRDDTLSTEDSDPDTDQPEFIQTPSAPIKKSDENQRDSKHEPQTLEGEYERKE